MSATQYSDLSEELRSATRLVGGRISRLLFSAAERLTQLEEEVDALRTKQRPRIAFTVIADAVSNDMNVTHAEIWSRHGDMHVRNARAIVVWLARETSGLSLTQIGKQMGGRDHSTVRAALQRADALRGESYWLNRMERIRRKLISQKESVQ